jgi:hypothetical protein
MIPWIGEAGFDAGKLSIVDIEVDSGKIVLSFLCKAAGNAFEAKIWRQVDAIRFSKVVFSSDRTVLGMAISGSLHPVYSFP